MQCSHAVVQSTHWPHVFRLLLHLCLVSSRSRLAALQLLKTEKIVATCIRRFESCGLHCPTTSATPAQELGMPPSHNTSTHSGMQTNNDYVHCVWKVNPENIYSPKTIDQAFLKRKKELEIKTWVITPQQNPEETLLFELEMQMLLIFVCSGTAFECPVACKNVQR